MKIYIAAPYTNGDVAQNVRKVMEVANILMDRGHYPYIPHLTHFQHIYFPRPYEDWLKLDNAFIPSCDALLRLEGKSSGADKEVELAKKLGLKIFYNLSEIWNLNKTK